jgi:hypothetical protein
MRTSRNIKRSYAIALLVFGLSAIFGLGFLMYRILPEITVREPSVFILLPGIVVAIVAALFIFGVFLGYFYRNPTARWLINRKTRTQFRNALAFERGERIRLERELYDTKQSVVGLKDKLSAAHKSEEKGEGKANDDLLKKIEKEKAQLEKRHHQLQTDLAVRKQRIVDLMTDIAIAQTEAEEARGEIERLKSGMSSDTSQRSELQIATEDASIKDVLDNLTKLEGIKLALVADDFGLVVETSHDNIDAENLAAASSLASRIASRLKEILTIGAITTVTIGDEDGLVLENTYFELFQLRCSLAIIRDRAHEYPGLADQTIEAISSRLAE